MEESKQQRFERIAERRVSETIKKIRLIGNLSDKKNYAYTEEHIKKIFDALDGEFRMIKSKFRSSEETYKESFSFKEVRQ